MRLWIARLSSGVAATWLVAGGFVTIVGVRDVAELGDLVDELQSLELRRQRGR